VQFDATPDQQEAKASAGSRPYIPAAMESLEQLLLIVLGNANPPIANHAHGSVPILLNREVDRRSCFGVFHRIAKQVREDMSEEPLIGFRGAGNGSEG
jgi:hypothetical protein